MSFNINPLALMQFAARRPNAIDAWYQGQDEERARRAAELKNEYQRLENQLTGIKTQYAPEEEQLTIANKRALLGQIPLHNQLLLAQIERQKSLAENPLMGGGLKGAAAIIQSLEMLKNYYGEDSPQYQEALRKYNTDIGLQEARSKYLGANAEFKNLPQLAKYEKLAQTAENSGEEELAAQYRANIAKNVSDTQTRQTALSANELSNTLEKIDYKPIMNYAGLQGRTKEAKDTILSALSGGKLEPETLIKYRQWKNQHSKLIADSLRKMLATSVVPEYVYTQVYPITNADNPIWNSPADVKARLDYLRGWVKNYAEDYTKAAKGIMPFSIKKKSTSNSIEGVLQRKDVSELTTDEIKQLLNREIPE